MIQNRKTDRSIALLLAISLFASCNNASTPSGTGEEAPKLLTIANIENPTSILLELVDKTEADTSIAYIAKGLYQDDTVGLLLEVSKIIPAGINQDGSVNEKDGFKKGVIRFRKSGPESDRFVSALAKLWEVDGVNNMKTEDIQPLVFSSNKKPADASKLSTNNFKLFFDDHSPNPGEIFFTFDTYKRRLEFQEKDAQHRATIVHAFAE